MLSSSIDFAWIWNFHLQVRSIEVSNGRYGKDLSEKSSECELPVGDFRMWHVTGVEIPDLEDGDREYVHIHK